MPTSGEILSEYIKRNFPRGISGLADKLKKDRSYLKYNLNQADLRPSFVKLLSTVGINVDDVLSGNLENTTHVIPVPLKGGRLARVMVPHDFSPDDIKKIRKLLEAYQT